MVGMASADVDVVPYKGPYSSNMMGVAWLSRLGDDGTDPFVRLCRIGL